MRNLVQYPVTDEDRLAVLIRLRNEASDNITERPIGVTLVVLDDLIKAIQSNKA